MEVGLIGDVPGAVMGQAMGWALGRAMRWVGAVMYLGCAVRLAHKYASWPDRMSRFTIMLTNVCLRTLNARMYT